MILTKIADFFTRFSSKHRSNLKKILDLNASFKKQTDINKKLTDELEWFKRLHNLEINELIVTGFTSLEDGDGGKCTLVLDGNIPKLGYAAYCYGNALDHRGIANKLAPFDTVLGGNYFSVQDQKVTFTRTSLTYGSVDGLVWRALQCAIVQAMQAAIIAPENPGVQ